MYLEIKREILTTSYWEHFKYAKDLAMMLPLGHPKRVKAEQAVNDIQSELKALNTGNASNRYVG